MLDIYRIYRRSNINNTLTQVAVKTSNVKNKCTATNIINNNSCNLNAADNYDSDTRNGKEGNDDDENEWQQLQRDFSADRSL